MGRGRRGWPILRCGAGVPESHVLVIDAGTSAIRCVVFNRAGETVGRSMAPWSYSGVDDAQELAREFDPAETWAAVRGIVALAMRSAGASQGDIAAVSVTSQRQGVAFLDGDGREVYVGPNLDLRAVFEGGEIDARKGPRVYRITGHTPSFLLAPAKLKWLRVHRPGDYSRVATALTLADWLVYRLTGEMATEPALASGIGLLDVNSRTWRGETMREAGLEKAKAPDILEAGEAVGGLTAEASAFLGIREGAPVAMGTADTQAGLLGLGTAEPGQAGIVAGWSAPLQLVTGSPVFHPEGRTWVECFPIPGRWALESSAGATGHAYRWVRDTMYRDEGQSFEAMSREAAEAPAGSEGVTAFLGPSLMDMGSLGMRPGGLLFPVPLTYSEPSRGHIARACLESVAYALKSNLAQAEALYGSAAADVAVGGGMTAAAVFTDILANVLGREVRVSDAGNASAFGAYLCAATALGDFTSVREASAFGGRRTRVVEPRPVETAQYRDLYEAWVAANEVIQEVEL